MTATKFLIPFVLASLAGHALVIALAARINMGESPQPEKVMTVELKTTTEVEPPSPYARSGPTAQADRTAKMAAGTREDTVALQNRSGPYEPYLLQIRRKIEGLWSYPAQALSEQREGSTEIRFTIDAYGALNDCYVTSTSGSPFLDEGALDVVRAAAPFAPMPGVFKLSRLHVTATFRYRIN